MSRPAALNVNPMVGHISLLLPVLYARKWRVIHCSVWVVCVEACLIIFIASLLYWMEQQNSRKDNWGDDIHCACTTWAEFKLMLWQLVLCACVWYEITGATLCPYVWNVCSVVRSMPCTVSLSKAYMTNYVLLTNDTKKYLVNSSLNLE